MTMVASTTVASGVPAAALAALPTQEADPVFAAIEAFNRATAKVAAALAAHDRCEKAAQDAGVFNPRVKWGKRVAYNSAHIEQVCPADEFPEENARLRQELKVAIKRERSIMRGAKEAVDEATDEQADALWDVVKASPTTMAGVLALLEFEREVWDRDSGLLSDEVLDELCITLQSALQRMAAN